MTQGAREPPEGVKEGAEAQGKRGIDPAQEQKQQEKEEGRLRQYATSNQYGLCREEAARLRQRIKQLERISDNCEAGSRATYQALVAQQQASESETKHKLTSSAR